MAKCAICESRKGKRQCRMKSAAICSLCCGSVRTVESCEGCSYYAPPRRSYNKLPRYSTQEMKDSDRLQEISFPIESAVCLLDRKNDFKLTDSHAIDIFEALLDMYAFGCSKEELSDRIRDLGCEVVFEIVEKELQQYIREDIIRVLETVRFVARRRACGGRHHLEVLHRYCGSFLESGIGLRIMENGQEVACNF